MLFHSPLKVQLKLFSILFKVHWAVGMLWREKKNQRFFGKFVQKLMGSIKTSIITSVHHPFFSARKLLFFINHRNIFWNYFKSFFIKTLSVWQREDPLAVSPWLCLATVLSFPFCKIGFSTLKCPQCNRKIKNLLHKIG